MILTNMESQNIIDNQTSFSDVSSPISDFIQP
jgi:hypothetical protein